MNLTNFFSKAALTLLVATGASAISTATAAAKTVSTEATAPFADTFFAGMGPTPENVAIKGRIEVHVRVNLPPTPCTIALPCANVPVAIGAEADDASGIGAITGKNYAVVGESNTQGTFKMPGGVGLLAKFRVQRGYSFKGFLTVKIFVIVDGNGNVTDVSTPPSGLVSWWRGEGDAADALGANPGTAVGTVTFPAGKYGQGFSFSPLSYVDAGTNGTLKLPKLTTSAWVKAAIPNTHPGNSHYVLSQGARSCLGSPYALASSTGTGTTFGPGNLAFLISDGVAAFPVSSPDAPATIWDGNWHFVAGTYDGAAIRLFVDGVEVGTGTPATLAIGYGAPAEQNFYIGAYHSSTCTLDSTGPIDEVRVFNRALSLAEIKALYQAAKIEPEEDHDDHGDHDHDH